MRRSWKAICVALAASLGGHAATALAQGPGPYYAPNMPPPHMMAAIPADAIPPAPMGPMGPGPGAGMSYYPGAAPGVPGGPMVEGPMYGGGAPMPPGAGAGMVYYPGANMGPPPSGGEEVYGGRMGRGHGGDCGGQWFVKGDVLWLDRTRAANSVVATIDDLGGVGVAALETDDDDFDEELGMRLFAGRYTANGLRLEAGYFGLNHYSSSAAITGAGGDVSVPFFGAGFPGAVLPVGFENVDTVGFSYDSDLHNAEFNVARNFFGNDRFWLSNLVGFRYFYLQEEFALTANGAAGSSVYRTRTTNNLIGGQVGTEGGIQFTPRFSVDVAGKLGLFGNANVQTSQISDLGVVIRDTEAHGSQFATIIDVSLNNTFAITRRLSVRGGYNVIVVSGLALAPEQLDFTVTSGSQLTVNDTGSVVFYGPHLGFDFKY